MKNVSKNKTVLWEVGGSSGTKVLDLSPFRYIIVAITYGTISSQNILYSEYISSGESNKQTQIGLYYDVNMYYVLSTKSLSFECDESIVFTVIGIK